MNYIVHNPKFNPDDSKVFEIYSNSTGEHLEYTCNCHDMFKVMQDNIDMMLDDELIDYQEAWLIRNDYIAYDEIVESLENVDY